MMRMRMAYQFRRDLAFSGWQGYGSAFILAMSSVELAPSVPQYKHIPNSVVAAAR